MTIPCQTPCGPYGACDFWTTNGCLLLTEHYLDDYTEHPQHTKTGEDRPNELCED